MKSNTKTITLANPRGFCAGVDRAINIVKKALAKHGSPIFVRHEVVHNCFVVANLKAKGVVFIEDLDEVPQGAASVVLITFSGCLKYLQSKPCGFAVG